MATVKTYAGPRALTRWRAREATIESHGPAAYAAEAIGTFLLVFFICAVISVGNAGVRQLDVAGLGLLHALVLMVLVYALGSISGGHFNPAVTFGLLSVNQIRARDAVRYFACQLVGGVAAAFLVLLLFHHAGASAHYGATAINGQVIAHGSPWLGLIGEAMGTFVLVWAVMAVAVNPRGESALTGVAIGGALGFAVMVFGPATGAGFNPARWLGPALASGTWADSWIYIVGPLVGAVLAARGYRLLSSVRDAAAAREAS